MGYNLCYIMGVPRNATTKGGGKGMKHMGMTREELRDYKKEALDAERLKIILILQEAKSLEQAIELIKQRVDK